MTIAIKIGDDSSPVRGLLYFDVVTSFSETRTGSVSSFPLDTGVSVGDHYIAKNPTYQLKGVLSSVDISGVSNNIQVDGTSPMNATALPVTPSILDFATGTAKLLPGSLKQFARASIPAVVEGESVAQNQDRIKEVFRELMNGVQYSQVLKRYQNKMTTVTLYEFDGNNIKTQHNDLVLTSFSIDEDPDTGDCIPLSLSFEKIRFVTVEKEQKTKSKAMKKTVKKGVKKPEIKRCEVANNPSATPTTSDPTFGKSGLPGSFSSLLFK
jgi:hypothetical protein